MKRVLFVCTGNTCRSPMAELYFNHYCACAGIDAVRAVSAGLAASSGDPISLPAYRVLAELGIEAGSFRSRPVDGEMVEAADLIVAMTASHRANLLERFPDAVGKTRLLLDFSGGGSVPDPFGGPLAVYSAVFSRMRPALEMLADFFGWSSRCGGA